MSKAVWIMDIPECCYDCHITVCDADNMSSISRSGHCPLRKLPEKKNYEAISDGTLKAWGNGWNACLDAIMEEL